jgi:hypothetical protein
MARSGAADQAVRRQPPRHIRGRTTPKGDGGVFLTIESFIALSLAAGRHNGREPGGG